MKSEIYKWKLDTRDELLSRIPDAAAYIKKSDKLRKQTNNFHTRVAKCTEVGGGGLVHLLWNVTHLCMWHELEHLLWNVTHLCMWHELEHNSEWQ
jgi:hypothetical protein